MNEDLILRRTVYDKEFVFDPTDILEGYSEEEQVYLRNYIKVLRFGEEHFSLKVEVGKSLDQNAKKNLQFRADKKNIKNLYDLQVRYAKYFFADNNIMDNIGMERGPKSAPYTISKIPQGTPPQQLRCIKPRASLPFSKKLRDEIIDCPKKALFPTTVTTNVDGTTVGETWMVGVVKGKNVLFRCYEEKHNGNREGFSNINSGMSLEMYVKGFAVGGKYITRSDFKPINEHPNFIDGNEVAEYTYKPTSSVNYMQVEPDHTHRFGAGYDLVFPSRGSTDIKVNSVQAKNFDEFKSNFYKLNNMDMTPILESIEGKENESVIKIMEDYYNGLAKSKEEKANQIRSDINTDGKQQEGGLVLC